MCVWLFSIGCKNVASCIKSIAHVPWMHIILSPLLALLGLAIMAVVGLPVVLAKFFPCLAARETALWKHYRDTVRSGCKAYKEEANTGSQDIVTCCRQCTAELYVLGAPVLLLLMLIVLPVGTLIECLLFLTNGLIIGTGAACVTPFSLAGWWTKLLACLHELDKETSSMAFDNAHSCLLLRWATSEAALAAERAEAEAARSRQLQADRALAEELQRHSERQLAAAESVQVLVTNATTFATNLANVSAQVNRWFNAATPANHAGAQKRAPSSTVPAFVPVVPSMQATVMAQPVAVQQTVARPLASSVPRAAPLPRAVPVRASASKPAHPWNPPV